MEQLGSKTAARQLAKRAGVPTVPGALDPIEKIAEARRIAAEIGFPVVAESGCWRRRKRNASDFRAPQKLIRRWRDAASEAMNAFGDARLYIEKYLERPRHIEIQIFGDQHGNMVSLGERECSVQRRHQKVIEEAPSPVMDAALRRKMGRPR